MWDRFSYRFWSLGRDPKNLWIEGLWEHPLNSIHGCSVGLAGAHFVALEVGVERTSRILCKRSLCCMLFNHLCSPPRSNLPTLLTNGWANCLWRPSEARASPLLHAPSAITNRSHIQSVWASHVTAPKALRHQCIPRLCPAARKVRLSIGGPLQAGFGLRRSHNSYPSKRQPLAA